ncbi:MAG: alanine racemase [Verrucomicrobiae bacterium]|nr:alanine racemase [Verrucomicrobiae bacterium]
MNAPYRCWAEVDFDALRSNLAWLRHRVGPHTRILTVVKADAYGHGLKQIAALLMQSGTDIFGVANLTEARSVRLVGRGWPVLMLGACLPEEIPIAVRDGIMPTLSTLAEARAFSREARRQNKTVEVHLKVDTGMGRLGARPEEAAQLARSIARLPGVRLAGLMTHFSSAEDDAEFTRQQRERFSMVLRAIEAGGVVVPYVHACNSGGVLWEPEAHFNLVRPGLLVYGIIPPGKRRPASVLARHLKPALQWKSRVTLVREVPQGTPLSYGHTYITPRPMRVAVVGCGYGDGYMRAASQRAAMLIRGRLCPVLGRVTMDQTLVDVTPLPQVKAGEEVVLLGRQGNKEITAAQLAGWFGTIPWEVLTNISYRVPRVYRGEQAA